MEIIISGFGGQGILTAGLIIAYTGNELGKQVLCSPSYGSEMRGGTANCCVTVSDQEIGSPNLPQCDVLIAMNEPSLYRFRDSVRSGGIIIVNESMVPTGYECQKGVRVYGIEATTMAAQLDNTRGANMIMLGALCRLSSLFTLECITDNTIRYFAEKGKDCELNAACIRAGYQQAGDVIWI